MGFVSPKDPWSCPTAASYWWRSRKDKSRACAPMAANPSSPSPAVDQMAWRWGRMVSSIAATMVGSNISKPMAFLRRTASRRIIQEAGLNASISKPARSKYCINRATSDAACVGRTTSCSTHMAGSGSPIMARLIMQNAVMMSSAFSMPRPMAAIWKKSSSRQTTPMALACPLMAARSTPPKPTPAD